jgi:serine/threonine protein phosphatase PrpC
VRDVVLLASSLQEKGERARAALPPHAAAILDAGGHNSINPKLWTCEDSLAVCQAEDGVLALVGDSHWGGAASECAARRLARSWTRASAAHTQGRLVKTLLLLEAAFQLDRPAQDRSETTVLIAHLTRDEIHWVSVGDSFLWVLGPHFAGEPALLNDRSMHFMGNFPLASSSAFSFGSRPLAPGERVLLASDGIEPQASGLEPSQVAAFLPGRDLEQELEALATRACDDAQGGGRDNLALVYLDPAGI